MQVISTIGSLMVTNNIFSAGVGRSGTLISLVNLTLQIMHLNKQEKLESKQFLPLMIEHITQHKLSATPLSVFSTVRRLREYRYLMVQTLVLF